MSTDIVEHVEQKFRSGNTIPVDRAHLSADEWAQLKAEIVRLRGEVDCSMPMPKTREEAVVLAREVLRQLDIIDRLLDEAIARCETSNVAPAEAKGDDTLLECTCHYLPFRDCPHIPHRTESQPAAGEAVAWLRHINVALREVPIEGQDEKWFAAQDALAGLRALLTASPAAQVQQEHVAPGPYTAEVILAGYQSNGYAIKDGRGERIARTCIISEEEDEATTEFMVKAMNVYRAAQAQQEAGALRRYGRGAGDSPWLLEPRDDGYWTPWHIAQNALNATHPGGDALGAVRANRQDVLNLSEAARCLGVAQAKGDQGAIDHWTDEVARYEAALRPSAGEGLDSLDEGG